MEKPNIINRILSRISHYTGTVPDKQSEKGSESLFEIIETESESLKDVKEFWFKSAGSVFLKQVEIKVNTITDTISSDRSLQLEAGRWYLLAGYEGITANQKWEFTFHCISSDSKTSFSVKSEYISI